MTATALSPANLLPNRQLAALVLPEVQAWAMERPSVIAAGLQPGMTVLDLGCGDGTVTRFLASEVGQHGAVFAVDVDTAAIEVAQASVVGRRGNPILFEAASAYDTGMPDASVDFVLARQLFQHLTDPARALAEIRRVLKPGGRVCLLDAHDGMLWLHPEPSGHAALVARATALQKLRGGDREVSRKLAGLLDASGFMDVWSDVHVYDTSHVPAEAFVDIALAPVMAIFAGDERDEALDHLDACRDALIDGQVHGSAGFVATWARKV